MPASAADQIRNVVARIAIELGVLADLDPQPDVVAIVMPPFVQDACQHVADEMRRRPRSALTPAEAFEGHGKGCCEKQPRFLRLRICRRQSQRG